MMGLLMWLASVNPVPAAQLVSTTAELQSALSAANSGTGDPTILLADGTYSLTSAPWGLFWSQ